MDINGGLGREWKRLKKRRGWQMEMEVNYMMKEEERVHVSLVKGVGKVNAVSL